MANVLSPLISNIEASFRWFVYAAEVIARTGKLSRTVSIPRNRLAYRHTAG
jgi:hypothetical protein